MTNAEAELLLEECAAKLGEHFDAVLLLGSWMEDGTGGTKCAKRGSGNFYARLGMAHEYISLNNAENSANVISGLLNPPDDSDDWKKLANT